MIWQQLAQIQQNKNIASSIVTQKTVRFALLPKNKKLDHKPPPKQRERRTRSQSCLILTLHAAHGQTVDAGSLPGTYGHNL
jgi:hypothetical protein